MTGRTQEPIATTEKLKLGGVGQWVVIRGRDVTNPVLLVLAGGPGGTALGWFRTHNVVLEEHFTVVHWEQRGAGKSFPLLVTDRRRMTPEQYVQDGLELTDQLRQRFGQDKIYLVGQSWGTFLGIWMVQRRPQWFHAYVGVGQMVSPAQNDPLQYQWTLERARRQGDTKVVKTLGRDGPPPYRGNPITVARKYGHTTFPNFRYMVQDLRAAGGTLRGGDIGEMVNTPEYRPLDKLFAVAGIPLTFGVVYPQLEHVDLAEEAPELAVPVYFVEGRYDANAMPVLAERYLQALRAPRKQLVWFERSGHNPCFEEAERFNHFMVDTVLHETQAASNASS
jgi:pimeloyl-ACP methyl ester carboxylesterase